MLLTEELLFQYKRCNRRAFLNVYGEESQKQPEKEFTLKLRQEKEFHSKRVLEIYNLRYYQPQVLIKDTENILKLALMTEDLMAIGVECIYQGIIAHKTIIINEGKEEEITLIAFPTLLIKQNIPSRWGNWSYFPVNTPLGKNIKPEYKIMSAFGGDILNQIQGINLSQTHIFLKNKYKPYHLNLNMWISSSRDLVRECVSMLANKNEPEIFISRQRCGFCQWYQSCYSLAKSQQNLSLIPGISQKKQELLIKNNITNFFSLSQVTLSDLKQVFDVEIANNIYQQTQSLFTSKAILKNILPKIPTNNIELYFDIEAEPERNLDYLLGVLLVNHQTQQQKYYTFLAKNIEEEENIWQEFVTFINQYENAPIFHYSPYEVETIKRLGYLYKTPSSQLKSILSRLFDLHKTVINSFFLPVENYSLKSIANWLGFHWRNPKTGKTLSNYDKVGGDQCVFWYDQWLQTGDRIWLDYILIYNEDDCLGTYELKKWLTKYQDKLA
ncbi:TM0106 family RecB-like putative nuclease [Geminocystis sp.]|uniref:TM0106 family RecB-like putative nuclease n=1 Tax=Geminocystis sp. TaxID=2664100 RepID=UPI0035933032